jgi:hypothetical protein
MKEGFGRGLVDGNTLMLRLETYTAGFSGVHSSGFLLFDIINTDVFTQTLQSPFNPNPTRVYDDTYGSEIFVCVRRAVVHHAVVPCP